MNTSTHTHTPIRITMYHPQPAAVNDGYQSIESIGWFIFHDLHLTHLIELVHGRIAPGQAEVEA